MGRSRKGIARSAECNSSPEGLADTFVDLAEAGCTKNGEVVGVG
jgi:hypothetical protein